MNFKIGSLVVLSIILVFLLSSCEVYQTLYGKPKAPEKSATQVVRVEGAQAKDEAILAKEAYATASATPYDPFKVGSNPLGPFPKGKSLGFTLGQWWVAGGIGIYSVDGENAELQISLQKLVPNGVYSVWCSTAKLPPDPIIDDKPCGKEDGSENTFKADAGGNDIFNLKLKTLESSTEETMTVLAVAYHSDGKTYGSSPGEFGMNTHRQLLFLMPMPSGNATKFQLPIKFVNHIDAGFPEQDVFVEKEEPAIPTGKVTEEKPKEEVMKKEEAKPVEIKRIKSEEKPVVIIVQETEFVSLVPKAEDPDKETNLVFTFTSPLNEKGEWQTNYGDSGEYTVTVTASDRESTTSRDVLIIINKKEESPAIDSAKPIESGLTVDETQAIEFNVEASDLNKDPLTYTWKIDGSDAGNENKYSYQTTYEDAGTHTVKVDVSDGISSTSKIWSVDVKNVNRKPVLEKVNDITTKETDRIVITALATDDDKDKITYSISDKRFVQEDNVFAWQTDYDSAGTYTVKIGASDGQDTTEQEFKVAVENVNRPPVIIDIVQKK